MLKAFFISKLKLASCFRNKERVSSEAQRLYEQVSFTRFTGGKPGTMIVLHVSEIKKEFRAKLKGFMSRFPSLGSPEVNRVQ
jgi:hypothetical protein